MPGFHGKIGYVAMLFHKKAKNTSNMKQCIAIIVFNPSNKLTLVSGPAQAMFHAFHCNPSLKGIYKRHGDHVIYVTT